MDTSQLNKPPETSTGDRIQAILAKANGGIPKSGGESAVAPAEQTETPEPAEAEAAPAEGEPAEPTTEVAEKPDDKGKKPAEKPEPKTARAKEWADLKEAKRETAEALREARRLIAENKVRDAELTKTQLELTKVQRELAEMDKLRRENPKEFVKRLGNGPGIREVLKSAIEEPEETPEQKELRELREWRKSVDERESAREKADREAREKAEHDQRQRGEAEFHAKNISTVRTVIDGSESELPTLNKQTAAAKGLIAREAYTRILSEFNRTGREPNILTVLTALERELFQAEQPASTEKPPAQASGADSTAKPEAKRTPVLSSATATSRAASPRALSYEEKISAASKKLRRA